MGRYRKDSALVMLTADEKELLRTAAKASGLTDSGYIRYLISRNADSLARRARYLGLQKSTTRKLHFLLDRVRAARKDFSDW